ncbi:MAG: protein kinase [Candidatus Brocadiae bacterium]|nr:protein kinase [Candidatus Brocadiia bacterium]
MNSEILKQYQKYIENKKNSEEKLENLKKKLKTLVDKSENLDKTLNDIAPIELPKILDIKIENVAKVLDFFDFEKNFRETLKAGDYVKIMEFQDQIHEHLHLLSSLNLWDDLIGNFFNIIKINDKYYYIIQKLGKGGFGHVYKALFLDPSKDKKEKYDIVAIKHVEFSPKPWFYWNGFFEKGKENVIEVLEKERNFKLGKRPYIEDIRENSLTISSTDASISLTLFPMKVIFKQPNSLKKIILYADRKQGKFYVNASNNKENCFCWDDVAEKKEEQQKLRYCLRESYHLDLPENATFKKNANNLEIFDGSNILSFSLDAMDVCLEIKKTDTAKVYKEELVAKKQGDKIAIYRDKIFREIKILSQISSAPSSTQNGNNLIANLLDHHVLEGEEESNIILIIKYIDGVILDKIIEGIHSVAMAFDIVKKIALALKFLEGEKIIHQDINPKNLIIRFINPDQTINELIAESQTKSQTEESENALMKKFLEQLKKNDYEIVLIDFGIAKKALLDFTLTFQVAGTKDYVAPERKQSDSGDLLTGKVDIFALGVIFNNMIKNCQKDDKVVPRELIQYIEEKLLATDPNQRPTPTELLNQIEQGFKKPEEDTIDPNQRPTATSPPNKIDQGFKKPTFGSSLLRFLPGYKKH